MKNKSQKKNEAKVNKNYKIAVKKIGAKIKEKNY